MLGDPLKNVRPWFAALLAATLGVRAWFALALADVNFYGEELEKGTAAKAMLDGLGVEHHRLAYHYYEGGGFVVSHLKALAFLLVGESLLAHKLVALGFVAAIAVSGFTLCRRRFGNTTAVCFLGLFAFGPMAFQKLSLISLGIHFEATLFLLLAFHLTMEILWEPKTRRRTYFFLGLVLGFGCYFSYQLAPAALWCASWIVWKKPRALAGLEVWCAIAGLLLGLAPLAVMFALVGPQVFFVHGTWLWGEGAASVPNSLRLREFLRSLFVGKSAAELLGPVTWPIAFVIASFAALRPDVRRSNERFGPASFLVLFAPFWLAVYAASSFVHGEAYHYYLFNRFSPLWLVAALVIARGLARLLAAEDEPPVVLGAACALFLTALGALGSWRILHTGRPWAPAANWQTLTSYKGYRYAPYFAKFREHLTGTRLQKLAVLTRFDEERRDLLWPEAAMELYADDERPLEALYAEFEAFSPDGAADLVRGLGPLVMRRTGEDLARALDAVAGVPERWRGPLLEGLGRYGSGWWRDPEVLAREVQLGLGRAGAEAYWFGLGDRLQLLWELAPDRAREFIAAQPEDARPALAAGWQAARERRTL